MYKNKIDFISFYVLVSEVVVFETTETVKYFSCIKFFYVN